MFLPCSIQVKQHTFFMVMAWWDFIISADERYFRFLAPAPWNQLVRTAARDDNVNCTTEDFYFEFMPVWLMAYFKIYGTIEKDVASQSCYQFIQQTFGNHLREIMIIMSYSLYSTGPSSDIDKVNRCYFINKAAKVLCFYFPTLRN